MLTASSSGPMPVRLQDIEKLAPKKGVTLQSVKEVVQALVDDDLGGHVTSLSARHCMLALFSLMALLHEYAHTGQQQPAQTIPEVSRGPAVHQDRIGASNFFWSFPSEAAVKVQSHPRTASAQSIDVL